MTDGIVGLATELGVHAAQTLLERPYRPYLTDQILTFSGKLAGSVGYTFNVLAGYQPPTITGGWPIINIIDRPLRMGYTIPAGYNPFTATVPVQFENVVRQPAYQTSPLRNVEFDIQKLEWMAGRGRLYQTRQGASPLGPATGVPPLVTVVSLDVNGNPTNLIPTNLHQMPFVITDIAYDTQVGGQGSGSGQQSSGGVIRDRSGIRTRQAAVITLTQYNAGPGAVNSPRQRQINRRSETGYKVYEATSLRDTVKAIVVSVNGTATTHDIQAVLEFNRSQLHVRSALQKLKIGTKVRIPTRYTSFH